MGPYVHQYSESEIKWIEKFKYYIIPIVIKQQQQQQQQQQ